MPKTMFIGLLVLIILIYIINSKHTPIIVKNNIKSFLIQTIFCIVALWFVILANSSIYDYSSSIILYNAPGFPNFWQFTGTSYTPYYFECGIRITFMILYIILGMSLTKEKSKIKNFLSVFICYLVLIIINGVIFPIYFENIYVWIPYIFISYSTHTALQRTTPLIYHTVFYVILFIPTLFIWLGLELKSLHDKKFIKRT